MNIYYLPPKNETVCRCLVLVAPTDNALHHPAPDWGGGMFEHPRVFEDSGKSFKNFLNGGLKRRCFLYTLSAINLATFLKILSPGHLRPGQVTLPPKKIVMLQ